MPASQQPDKMQVVCPHCGHSQPEPRGAFSTVCKKCRGHIAIEDAPKPARKPAAGAQNKAGIGGEGRKISCFECGTELEVSPSAQSTMCKQPGYPAAILI